MPAPTTFNLPVLGSAPNQHTTEALLEAAVQDFGDSIYDGFSGDITRIQAEVEVFTSSVDAHSGAGDILAAVRDEAGNGTFMTARTRDGGPTAEAAALIGQSMREAGGLPFENRTGSPFLDALLFAVADETGRVLSPDLQLRRSDGRFTDAALASISERLPIPRSAPDGTWPHPMGGRFARYDADLRDIVSWGSSSPAISAPAWEAMAAELGASFINRARGGATNEHIMIQLGVIKPTVTGGALASAAGSSVSVTVETMTAARAPFLLPVAGTLINGEQRIEGTIAYDATALRFTRKNAGAAVTLSSGWRMWPDAEAYRNRMSLIWSAKNDITEGDSAAVVAAEVLRITGYMSPVSPRYLVIGLFPNPGYTTEQAARLAQAEDLLAATYGALYVPVMPSLLGTAIFSDLGLTPTPEDLAARSAGRVPPSLMQDPNHLTVAAYGWIATHLIKPKLTTELGWYQEA